MICQTCKRLMTQLFLSTACDYCDFGVPKERLHRGFLVHRPAAVQAGYEDYVFRTRTDAEKWQEAAGLKSCAIREVYSLMPFRWHLSNGMLNDIVLAQGMYEVFPDHRFEPLPNRVFLAES
jgi:hypothetical protein